MLELLNKIDEINSQLLVHLKTKFSKDKDEYIEKLNFLLDIRDQLIIDVQQAQTVEEKQLGDKIIKDNQQINELLKHGAQQLKREINQFNLKKKNNQKYDNPYQISQRDGVFIDKKN